MCTLCYKCHDALLKGHIPKFSVANDVWLGDVPPELQGLTIPEEKLISLYRHNSCVIKLHSPFHSATTSQTALKGNCITFLQNIPNIVTSLSLALDDLGVLDVNGSMVSSDDIAKYFLHKVKNSKTEEQMDNERVYLIPHSSKPVSEYFNPKLLPGLYPTLFCYGRGAPESQTRPVEINLREHIRYLLSYSDRRFEKNHSFIFVVFNILQRRDACFHAHLIATKPYFRSSAHEIQSLSSEDIETALKNISERTYHMESSKAFNKLLNHIETIGGRVMGSVYSRTHLRTKIHALIYNQGLTSIFLTLNPADIHSPVALYFAGVKLDLDNIQTEQLMDTYKRAEIIASHPVATAKFFHILITNMLDTMILGGVLGPIKAYFGTVESQGRGSLHLHLLIWLDHDMTPAYMKEKIQNVDFREKLIAYLEDIIKEDLDEFKDKHVLEYLNDTPSRNTSPRLSKDNIYTALHTIDITDFQQNINQSNTWSTPVKEQLSSSISQVYASPKRFLQTPTHNRSIFGVDISYNETKSIPSCLATPNPSSPNFRSRFRADVVQLVEADNIHKHTDTCYKYHTANQGDKKNCRLYMPRKLVPTSSIDPDTGHISMRRSHPWINNFNEYLISACRSNMDIKFIWSGSDAKPLVYYITDYITKTIALEEEEANRKGRPPNERYPFQKQHSQVTTHLMMKYSQPHVPVLYGPQIPRRDRDDTRER
ncbi:unnamed protein product [Rotaria sordida]|uniref:Helitron helicase-like domain-containing protein n=1 Tax=Rotaria sordida TaxID=392033 RepID=A0A815Q7Q9_9BILA|nr:unnamed protein product [Rotaria sordida]